jgi:hypothetical protein
MSIQYSGRRQSRDLTFWCPADIPRWLLDILKDIAGDFTQNVILMPCSNGGVGKAMKHQGFYSKSAFDQ